MKEQRNYIVILISCLGYCQSFAKCKYLIHLAQIMLQITQEQSGQQQPVSYKNGECVFQANPRSILLEGLWNRGFWPWRSSMWGQLKDLSAPGPWCAPLSLPSLCHFWEQRGALMGPVQQRKVCIKEFLLGVICMPTLRELLNKILSLESICVFSGTGLFSKRGSFMWYYQFMNFIFCYLILNKKDYSSSGSHTFKSIH